MRTFLCDLHYMDPTTSSPGVLRFATVGYRTEPTDTPANAVYRERLRQPATLARNAFQEAATFGRAVLSYGEIELTNGDGDLDVLRTYGFDGQRVVIRAGDSADAFADFVTILTGTVEGCEVGRSVVRVRIRSRELALLVPLQPNKYAGSNVLPDGLEGTADDLKGKPKPLCFGTVKNVPAVLVNSAKLIYQVHDGPISSVDRVYDRGIQIGVAPRGWATLAHGLGNFAGRALAKSVTALVVGGYDGTSTPKIFRSTDGSSFSDVTSLFSNQSVEGSAYGASVFVAVGFRRSGAGDCTIASSADDGQTWTSRSLPASWVGNNVNMLSVRWHARVSLFLITTADGRLATSPDGTTWTDRTSGVAVALYNSAGDGDISLVVGASGTVLGSTDLTTWSDQSGELNASDVWYAVTNDDDGRWVIVGNDGGTTSKAFYSDSLPAWTAITSPPTSVNGGPFEAIYENGFWISAGTRFGYSLDGDDWTAEHFAPSGFSAAFDIILFNSRFYATGDANSAGLSATPAPISYADKADLLNDNLAPAPGHYGYWLAGGYFRLGSFPAGLVTADVTEGGNAKMRSPSYVFRRMLWQPWRVGGPFLLWKETDLEDWYTAFTHVMGFWTADEVTIAQALDLVAMTSGNWWGSDKVGRIRTAQFTAPSGSSVLDIDENQVIGLERLPAADITRGIPPWRSIVRWGRLYVVQTTDVAGGVTDARRGELAKEWREAKAEDETVKTVHILAPQIVEDSLLATEAGAQAEATRRQALRGTLRDVFQFRMELNAATEALELGDIVDLTHSRFGLSGGELCRVIGIDPNARDQRVLLTVFK